jgi:predicted DNA-binding protein with PD1-like motif
MIHAFRLLPGNDLKKEIQSFATKNKIEAGWIACCVGSLIKYNLRFANQKSGISNSGYFEIVCLTGTVSNNGCHLHINISNETGTTIGGHLLEDNIINTTAEIIIQEATDLVFTRENDGTTQWEELQIKKSK